jgi:hypothetical protein
MRLAPAAIEDIHHDSLDTEEHTTLGGGPCGDYLSRSCRSFSIGTRGLPGYGVVWPSPITSRAWCSDTGSPGRIDSINCRERQESWPLSRSVRCGGNAGDFDFFSIPAFRPSDYTWLEASEASPPTNWRMGTDGWTMSSEESKTGGVPPGDETAARLVVLGTRLPGADHDLTKPW